MTRTTIYKLYYLLTNNFNILREKKNDYNYNSSIYFFILLNIYFSNLNNSGFSKIKKFK